MISVQTILELGKSFTAKSTKDDSGAPTTVAQVKFSGLKVERDAVDELLGMPIGWCSKTLYDEQGAPLRRFGVSVFGRLLRVSGVITGIKPTESLSLLQAELTDGFLTLIPLGALLEGTLTWGARGDEVEDISNLLGKTCNARWEITDGDQGDMFSPTSKGAAAATEQVSSIVSRIGKTSGPRPDAAP